MSQAHANAAPRGFGNDLGCALQFWSDRHHANPATRRLPEPLEAGQLRSQQIPRRVHPPARMADEWPLQMNSEWAGLNLAIPILSFALFDGVRQPFECAKSRLHRSGDGGWKITRDPMPREQLLDRRQRLGGVVHDVISGAAVNVQINVTRRHHAVAEVGHRNPGGNLAAAASGNFEDTSLLDEHQRLLDGVSRSQQPSSGKSQHRNVLIAVKGRLRPRL